MTDLDRFHETIRQRLAAVEWVETVLRNPGGERQMKCRLSAHEQEIVFDFLRPILDPMVEALGESNPSTVCDPSVLRLHKAALKTARGEA